MVAVGTRLRIIDNSGARFARCIRILGHVGRGRGKVGDIVIVSIKEALPGKKIKKGSIQRGVIVRVAQGRWRKSGDKVNFEDNAIVIITKRNLPIASRVLGAVMSELREYGFIKIVGLAQKAV
jgi:large subunit ribosomal protein L14